MLRFFKINLIEISSLKPQPLKAYNFLIKFQPPEEKKSKKEGNFSPQSYILLHNNI